MALLHEKILSQIVSEIESRTGKFSSSLSAVENEIYRKIVDIAKDLQVDNGKITQSVQNISRLQNMVREIQKILESPAYRGKVSEMEQAFKIVENLQNNYFSSLVVDFKPKKVLTAIKNDAVNYTVDGLVKSGVPVLVSTEMEKVLNNNIRQGGSISDMIDQTRSYLKGGVAADGTKIPGRLTSYASQLVTDSLNQFSANYNEAITSDLGWNWRMYTGSLLETSRQWCVHMVKKKYVHKSELNTVITDHIDGVKICSDEIPCSKKTGLPRGMIEGTNASNIGQRRGGWQCGHQFGGVPDAVVPLNLREAIKQKTRS